MPFSEYFSEWINKAVDVVSDIPCHEKFFLRRRLMSFTRDGI